MTKQELNRTWLLLLTLPLLLAKVYRSSNEREIKRKLRRDGAITLTTSKLSATSDDGVLNVHIVPHTHDDVGWLKTVEEYFYGLNQTIQHAHVQSIITTVMEALLANPNRTFSFVETKFFSMWWKEQRPEMKETVKFLIQNDQLAFINGGWCMHDEATTHFMGMIDQTTLGHDFLFKELGVIPTVGWQLDPFGHSATQASYMTHDMGFDALYFGRIDYQDLAIRQETKECEGLWASRGTESSVFWGLTGGYLGNYGPPSGFCFDINCDDQPIVELDNQQLLEKVISWTKHLQLQASRTKGNNIMQTMGSDFAYEQAAYNFANYDLLMTKLLEYQETKQIDIPSIFGPKFKRLNVFYSTPIHYSKMKHQEAIKKNNDVDWTTKVDDFMPYADQSHGFWTGYFTSRTGFKRFERVGSSFLLAARQIESIHRDDTTIGMGDCKCMQPLYELEDALGVSQHHDAVSGTAKQHVANDYAKRLQSGIDKAASYAIKKIKTILLDKDEVDNYLNDMMFCQRLNETKCEVTENESKKGDKDIYIIVYNPLASTYQTVIAIPVEMSGAKRGIIVKRLGDATSSILRSSLVPSSQEDGKFIFHFDTGPLPPTGASVYVLVWGEESKSSESNMYTSAQRRLTHEGTTTLSNGVLTVDFDSVTGGIQKVTTLSGVSVDLSQEWGFYTSFDSYRNPGKGDQNSGAYIFRPSEPNETITQIKPKSATFHQSELITEITVEFEQPWVRQTMRLLDNKNYIEVEYTVGPIPINDGIGKEVVTRFSSGIQNNGVFFTDSNAREFQRRVRSFRPTWTLSETEPVAGNYYPVNSAIFINGSEGSLSLVTDRSVGGSSLADGSIEVMVQRRILRDDFRGVDEALNETTLGVNPYPPFGDATRQGDGIIIKGTHRIMIGGVGDGAMLARLEMDKMFASPLVFAASSPSSSRVPLRNFSFMLLNETLPNNVMLITHKLLLEAPATTFLIRLGHQFGEGEEETFSKPVVVCLGRIVFPHFIVSITEMTLSGNQELESWAKLRINWNGGNMQARQPVACTGGSCMVELKPMEIRTFQVQVGKVKT